MRQNKAPAALVGRLSLSVRWENSPERGLKTASFNHYLPVILANNADADQMPRSGSALINTLSIAL